MEEMRHDQISHPQPGAGNARLTASNGRIGGNQVKSQGSLHGEISPILT